MKYQLFSKYKSGLLEYFSQDNENSWEMKPKNFEYQAMNVKCLNVCICGSKGVDSFI